MVGALEDADAGALKHQAHGDHKDHEALPPDVRRLSGIIVDAGLKVHRTLGPGLLETAYEQCLAQDLRMRGVGVRRQVVMPILYEGVSLEPGYRLDLLVEEAVIIEVKAVDTLARVHEAQMLTYLRLSKLRLGFLMNFNVMLFKQGVKRFVL